MMVQGNEWTEKLAYRRKNEAALQREAGKMLCGPQRRNRDGVEKPLVTNCLVPMKLNSNVRPTFGV